MKKLNVLLSLALLLTLSFVDAQPRRKNLTNKVNLVFGLNQQLLNGFNVEGNLFLGRLAFDYSHGVSLHLDNAFLDPVNQNLGLDVHIPWTTGFGVGYRFNEWFNVRAEPKWHKFELYYEGQSQTEANLIGDYTTFTMGIGAYANLQPFKNQENFLRGFMVAPSIRYWPRVTSSLDNHILSFDHAALDQQVNHEVLEVGVSDTPIILNISIGYSFDLKNNRK